MSTFPLAGAQRILAGAPTPSLRVLLLDQDGDAVAPGGALTCTITRADGTVVATDRATSAATGVGAYTCELTTAEALALDVLTAVWSDGGDERATTYHRIVGGFPFRIDELSQRAGIAEGSNVAELRAERDRITDLVEDVTGVAWCRRYDRTEFEGHGHTRHALAWRPVHTIRELTIDDSTIALADVELNVAAGIISGVTFSGQCVIGWEHGRTAPPDDLRSAMITAAADSINRARGVVGPRVRSISDGMGVTQQFSYAGEGHPTGLDEVDAVLMRYARARI